MARIRTIHWGTGAMGSRALGMVATMPGIEAVAVISHRSLDHGRAVAQRELADRATAVITTDGLERAVELAGGADVLLLATNGDLEVMAAQMTLGCRLGLNVICIAEHTIFPWAVDPLLAAELHASALRAGVAVVGTGANPGFLMDYVPLVLATAAGNGWRRLVVRRRSHLDPYGETVLRGFGVGLAPAEFEQLCTVDPHIGHRGFEESVGFLAAHLGTNFSIVAKQTTPILGHVPIRVGALTVPAGHVIGLDQRCTAALEDGRQIVLEHPQVLSSPGDEEEAYDTVELDGATSMELRATTGIDGGAVTVGLMVNLIPTVAVAPPGLHTIASFTLRAVTAVRRPVLEWAAA